MPSPSIRMPEHLIPTEVVEDAKDLVITEQHMVYARLRWPDATPKKQASNVRRSIMATFRTRQTGPDGLPLLGGPREGTGRRRNKPIGTAIVEHFEDRQKEVLDAIAAPLSKGSGATPMERHRAGMNIAEHARKEAAEKREADAYARMSEDEVFEGYADMIVDGIMEGKIDIDQIISKVQAEQPIDATARELPPGEPE